MKRFVIAAALMVAVLAACFAQPVDVDITYDGSTPRIVVWDAVTTDASGDPLLPGDEIEYEVFYDRAPFGGLPDAVSLGVVQLPEATIVVSTLERGYYYVGVRSIGTDVGGTSEVSDIAWSNDPVSVGPTQRFAYLVTGTFLPATPTGLETLP